MKIQRDIISQLIKWKEADTRKPLLLKGARQVGKTWVMEEFGKTNFKYVAYFNFEKTEELAEVFKKTREVDRLLKELSLFTDNPIEPGNTLIIFDEIQACEMALNSLKYFCEDAPQYHVIAAGSLLGVAVRKKSMSVPVGKVQILRLYPISFKEFLSAVNPKMVDYVEQMERIELLPNIIFEQIQGEYKRYTLCGGMPEVLNLLFENRGMQEIEVALQNILDLYTLDFSKYATYPEIPRINNLWNSLPSQLAKENRKFLYKVIKSGARAREYEDALLWLEEAGLVYRIFNITKPGFPLNAYQDITSFKVYAFDCGLLRRLARLSPEIILSANIGYTEFKGALAENAILQSLIPQSDGLPFYWSSENRAEVDFVIQHGTDIVPIEVKAENRISGKSLSVYSKKYSPRIKIRYTTENLKIERGVINIPHCLSDWTRKWVDLFED
ncbi:AAA family ATPase [Bacteroidales bacterium OttesenSCG-928-B11]|nr:AAA family ATPase [Bacteroidales bacterium OttesenSCG-928-B11]MDL2325775.1 AAA family ATPase [Bacteroidales bacterium OttesenSCG-928-A14]